jgi:hypothetical protein
MGGTLAIHVAMGAECLRQYYYMSHSEKFLLHDPLACKLECGIYRYDDIVTMGFAHLFGIITIL